jgi:hypothetical protein
VDAVAVSKRTVSPDAHARFLAELAQHLAGILPAEETEWMEDHAVKCAACGTLLARGRAGLAELGAGGVHVPVRMLTLCLTSPDELTPLERELVARHLKACEACRKDFEEMALASGTKPVVKGSLGPFGSGTNGAGIAMILAVLLGAALVFGTFLPRRQSMHPPPIQPAPPVAAVPSPTPEALGGEPLLVFHEATRGTIRPAPASDTLGFGQGAIRVQLPALFVQRDVAVLITVTSAAGREVARVTLPAEALDRPFELTATVGPWNAGDYALRVIPDSGRDPAATRVFEFRLIQKPH